LKPFVKEKEPGDAKIAIGSARLKLRVVVAELRLLGEESAELVV